jgi:hypothetical protein
LYQVRIILLGRHILHADYGINKENMVYKRKFPKCYYSESI